MFRGTLQKCLVEANFQSPGDPSSFTPICLLDTLGKPLEKIPNRLIEVTESESGLTKLQFGFRKGLTTIDAMLVVI